MLPGVFSSPITLSNFTSVTGYSAYGVEFSPNGRFLYAAEEEYYVPCNLYQYDLNAGSNAAIEASRTIIGVDYPDHSFGSLQLGPDHKIYVARNNASVIGVINNPDFLAPSCNYDSLGVNIFPATCYLGLPNEYVNSVISPTLAAFTSPTSVCPVDALLSAIFQPMPPATNGLFPVQILQQYRWKIHHKSVTPRQDSIP